MHHFREKIKDFLCAMYANCFWIIALMICPIIFKIIDLYHHRKWLKDVTKYD